MTRRTGSAGEQAGPLITTATMLAVLALCLPLGLLVACGGPATPGTTSRGQPAAGPLARAAAGAQAAPEAPLAPRAQAAPVAPKAPAAHAAGVGLASPKATVEQEDGGTGMRLLQEAAKAGSNTSYQGVEMVSAWGVAGTTTMIADVWHRSGGNTLVRAAMAGAVSPGQASVTDDTNSQAPEGVLGVTGQLVALLGTNYDISYVGPGSADSRPAQVVEAWREDGTLAARFWLDKVTKIPLRRETFDTGAHLIGEDVFIDLELGPAAVAQAPMGDDTPGATQLTASDVTAMRARGWPVPAALPGGLALFQAREAATKSGKVLDLGYSDGLFVVSVFVQRGDLAPKLAGWQKVTLGGRALYAAQPDQRSLTWSGRGFVFTVMADAPPATLDRAVDTLPYSSPPGFWGRLSRGFLRLASWVDPFH
jgi:sigma-E factor negative regulatory protein RseB